MSRRLVVWRHGRTEWNEQQRVQGQLDIPLDAVGRAQIAVSAPVLAAKQPAFVVSSDLSRAAEGAALLASLAGVPLELDRRLREVYVGTWQGLTMTEVMAQLPEEYAAWRAGEDIPRGGGERKSEVGARSAAAFFDAADRLPADGLGVLVTHGGTTLSMLGAVFGWPPGGLSHLGVLHNCRWGVLAEWSGGWRLEEYGVEAPGMPGAPSGVDAAYAPGRPVGHDGGLAAVSDGAEADPAGEALVDEPPMASR
jgi:broad specificity phosphatase PhoE